MNLHQAEFIAGELIVFYICMWAISAVWRQHEARKQAPERGETTEFSSTTDD